MEETKTKQKTVEWFDDRFYKVLLPPDFTREDFYPSVTTILGIIDKPWLRRWYGDLGTELAAHRSAQAKARGSLIHDIIHNMLLFDGAAPIEPEKVSQEDWYQVWNFSQWYENVKPRILGSELTVVSHAHRYAGTLDLLVQIEEGEYNVGYAKPITIPKGIYVGDIKTGNYDAASHYQTVAYAMAVEETKEWNIDGTFILQTNADTKKGWKAIARNRQEMLADFDCFLSAKRLYDARGQEKPRVFEMPAEIKLKLY